MTENTEVKRRLTNKIRDQVPSLDVTSLITLHEALLSLKEDKQQDSLQVENIDIEAKESKIVDLEDNFSKQLSELADTVIGFSFNDHLRSLTETVEKSLHLYYEQASEKVADLKDAMNKIEEVGWDANNISTEKKLLRNNSGLQDIIKHLSSQHLKKLLEHFEPAIDSLLVQLGESEKEALAVFRYFGSEYSIRTMRYVVQALDSEITIKDQLSEFAIEEILDDLKRLSQL